MFVNGAFGVGKTSVARVLAKRLPRAFVYDPELLGIALQRVTHVADFQDLRVWRRLTTLAIRIAHRLRANVIVPMAFSNVDYLNEIRAPLQSIHVCLVAPLDVVQQRIRTRNHRDEEWQSRRAAECCDAHRDAAFAIHVDATRGVEEISGEIVRIIMSAREARTEEEAPSR